MPCYLNPNLPDGDFILMHGKVIPLTIKYHEIGAIEMPLIKGKAAKSKQGFSKNVATEVRAGKPKNQAVAIAYSEARRGEKKKK